MSRGNQFFDIGVQGRKTGVSIPHQELDAFGFENPDGFFSPSPALEKASQPLDAFLTGTQGRSDATAAPGSPALAGGDRREVAMSGSGEESMDIDSGVDASAPPQRLKPSTATSNTLTSTTKSIAHPPSGGRSPFKPFIHMTTDSPNALLSTPPRRASSIGPTSSRFTSVNPSNIPPTRPSSSSVATAATTQSLNRVLFNSDAGGGLQSPVITGQPPRRPRTPSVPPLAKSALQARQLNKKELTVFSSPVGPEVGRGVRQRSVSIGREEHEEGEIFDGKVNGAGNGNGEEKGISKVSDVKKPAVEKAADTTTPNTTTPAEKPTAKSKTAPEQEATKSKQAPIAKPLAVQAKKKLLSSIIPTKPPPPFSLSDCEDEQAMRPTAAVRKAMRVQQVVEEVSITEVVEDEDEGEEVGVSGKKWGTKAMVKEKVKEKEKEKVKVISKAQPQAQIKAVGKGRKKAEQENPGKGTEKVQGKGKRMAGVSDVVEEPEEDQVIENEGEVEEEAVEEEAEEGGDEAPPTPQPTKNKKKLAQAPVAAPVKRITSKAKIVLEPVPVQTKSKAAAKGRKVKAALVEEESLGEEEEQVDEIIEEMAEVEPEPTPQKKKLSKKAAKEVEETRRVVDEATAAKAAKDAEKKKRGKKVPEPELEPEEVEEMEVDQDEEVLTPQQAKKRRSAKSAAAPSSSSAPAPTAKGRAARGKKAAGAEADPGLGPEPETVVEEEPETPVPVRGKKGSRGNKVAAAVEELAPDPSPTAMKKTGRGKKPAEPAFEREVSEVEPELELVPAAAKKAQRKKVSEPVPQPEEAGSEPTAAKGTRTKSQGKGKSKAAPVDASQAAVPPLPVKSTKATKATTTKTIPKSSTSKGKGKAKATNDEDTEMHDAGDPAASQLVQEANNSYYSDDEADVSPPTKKTRKSKTTTASSSSPPKASSSKQPSSSKPTKSTKLTKSSQQPPRSVTPDLQQARPPQQKIHIFPLVAPVISPSDANKRRSGRARTAPLNFWTGEKVVTKIEEREDGKGREVVKEVLRVEEPAVSRYKKPVARGRSNSTAPAPAEGKPKSKSKSKFKSVAGQKRKRGATKLSTVPEDGKSPLESAFASESSEEDGESDFEPWELTTGSYSGLIKSRDGSGQLVESIIAYAPHSMTTNPVAGAMFRMNKTVSLDHLGTGIIDIPPGGIKRWKPSGRYDLVFYVVKGKVGVMVGENGFMCRRGGQFQVARGNLYSIENQFSRPAKLFFVQGCEVPAPSASTSTSTQP